MPFPYQRARSFLENTLRQQLPHRLKAAAEEIVSLHLDPRNFPMSVEGNQRVIHNALAEGKNAEEVRRLISFEDTNAIRGVARVMARTHLNRQGIGSVTVHTPRAARTLSPRVLGIFDIFRDFPQEIGSFRAIACAWYELAKCWQGDADPQRCFSRAAVDVLGYLHQLEDETVALIEQGEMPPRALLGMMAGLPDDQIKEAQSWVKVVLGVSSGFRYLHQRYKLDPTILWQCLGAVRTAEDVFDLTRDAQRAVYEFGSALAPSFFADLGAPAFCKPDTHVLDSVSAIRGSSQSQSSAVAYVFQEAAWLASHGVHQVSPRQIDKIMFLGCSGRWYLILSEPLPNAGDTKKAFLRCLASA